MTPDPAPAARDTTTFFSSRDFVRAWARRVPGAHRAVAVPVRGSGPPRAMYALRTAGSYGRHSVALAPGGFYASPGWDGRLERSTLKGVLDRVTGLRATRVVWDVRYDHGPLADGLRGLGLDALPIPAHVLPLHPDYDRLVAGFSATQRNQIRSGRRRGVTVRETADPADVGAYYQVHLRQVGQKADYGFVYPEGFLLDLVRLPGVARFLVAECEGKVVAGGLFLRDGASVYYFHGAYDRDYADRYPVSCVLDEALRWACGTGAETANLGNSAGIASLEKFKASWGARPRTNWQFEWTNPLWPRLGRLRSALPARLRALPGRLKSVLRRRGDV